MAKVDDNASRTIRVGLVEREIINLLHGGNYVYVPLGNGETVSIYRDIDQERKERSEYEQKLTDKGYVDGVRDGENQAVAQIRKELAEKEAAEANKATREKFERQAHPNDVLKDPRDRLADVKLDENGAPLNDEEEAKLRNR
jgi:hypothetical protein